MKTLSKLGTLPVALTVLTACTALYYTLVAFTNWTDWGTNWQFVDKVFDMSTTFGDKDVTWRGIESNGLVSIAYTGVLIWESLIALVLIAALVYWLRALLGGGDQSIARRLSTLGWVMVWVLFLGGFITVGGEWFMMWQSSTWNGLTPALQNFTIAGLGVILANLQPRADAES